MWRSAFHRLSLKQQPSKFNTGSRQLSSILFNADIITPSSTPGNATSSSERTIEQMRAARLEYESILKVTDQVLALEKIDLSASRAVKRALNYWTSVQANLQVKNETHSTSVHSIPIALKIFFAMIERGDAIAIQQIIKTDEDPMGGLSYLIEHLLFAFRESHQLAIIEKSPSKLNRNDLFYALQHASSVLDTMKKLQADPQYPDIPDDPMYTNLIEVNLWSKRCWFLKQFPDHILTTAECELSFGGQSSVKGCTQALMRVAEVVLTQDDAPHMKVYNMLISTWVHSGLANSLDVVLSLLRDMENDDRITSPSPNPYCAVMFLCAKQKAISVARNLWNHLNDGSGVELTPTMIAAYLLALIDSDQLDDAIMLLNEMERKQVAYPGLTNTTCYNVILLGLSRSGRSDAAFTAEAILQLMIELYDSRVNLGVSPDRISYSTVMEILSGRSGAKVDAILLRCKELASSNKALEPDRVMYNIALDSYAKDLEGLMDNQKHAVSASAVQRAEGLLRAMEANPDSLPNTISYNSVLNVYEKACVDISRVEALFQEMKDKFAAGDVSVRPDIFTYNIMLRAVSRDCVRGSMDNAISLMQEMQQNGIDPDRITYNTVMDSLIKKNEPGAAIQAESMLQLMEHHAASGGGVRPDSTSYNTVLNGYAKLGTQESVARAERLLRRMLDMTRQERSSTCRPDHVSYACIMDAYARSRSPTAGFQAEALLDSMEAEGIPANTICYNAAINCWAKCGHEDAPARSEQLLNRMRLAAVNNPDVSPNSISFSSVINCWAQSNLEGAAERANQILDHMETLARNGEQDLIHNAYPYAAVISAWSRTGQVDKAIAILNRMEDAHAAGRSHVRPNVYCYNAAINAIAKSRIESKAELAVQLLNRIKLQHEIHGDVDLKPSAVTYSSVLNACAFAVCKDENEKANTFRIAREIFQDLSTSFELNSVCYSNFLSACMRLLPPGSMRSETLEALFRDCQRRGHVNDKLARSFKKALGRDAIERETVTSRAQPVQNHQ